MLPRNTFKSSVSPKNDLFEVDQEEPFTANEGANFKNSHRSPIEEVKAYDLSCVACARRCSLFHNVSQAEAMPQHIIGTDNALYGQENGAELQNLSKWMGRTNC